MIKNNMMICALVIFGIAFLLSRNLFSNQNILIIIPFLMALCYCMKIRNSKNNIAEMCFLISIYFTSVLLSKLISIKENYEEVVTSNNTTQGDTTTQAPTTQAPTTQAPTTQAATTQAPTTQAPTTQAPTTQAATTQAATTQAPTTQAATTQAATTQAATTQAAANIQGTTKKMDNIFGNKIYNLSNKEHLKEIINNYFKI